jgi:hypothetical protein
VWQATDRVVRQKVTVAGFAQKIALRLEDIFHQALAHQCVQSVAKGFANLEGGRVLAECRRVR